MRFDLLSAAAVGCDFGRTSTKEDLSVHGCLIHLLGSGRSCEMMLAISGLRGGSSELCHCLDSLKYLHRMMMLSRMHELYGS